MTGQTSTLAIEVDSTGAAGQLGVVTGRLNRLTNAGERTSAQMSILSRSLGLATAAAAGYATALASGDALDTASRLEQINSRLAASTDDVARVQRFLTATANEAGQAYLTLADGFSRLLPLQKGGLLTMQQLEKVTLGLANASTVLGVETADVNLALRGLTQIVSNGNARTTTEDFNQVFDNLGGVLIEVEKSAGLASGGLRQLVKSTEGISGTDILSLLVDGLDEFEGKANALSGNIAQSFNRTRTAYQLLVQDFSRPINFAAAEGADAVTDALELIRENADEIGVALQGVGAVLAASLGGAALASVGRYASSLSFAIQQTTFFLGAEKAAAVASQANAAAKLESALASESFAALKLKETQQVVASTTGLKRLTLVTTELAAAERAAAAATASRVTAASAATAATTRLAAANKAATVSARALAVAQRAGNAAMALVGGPAGLAFTAAAGLIYLITKQDEAERSTRALEEAQRGLADAYAENAEAAGRAAQESINEQRAAIVALEREYQAMLELYEQLREGGGVSARDLPIQESDLRAMAEQIEEAKQRLEEFEQSVNGFEISTAYADEFDALQEALRNAGNGIAVEGDSIREAIEGLFPNDAKIEKLKTLRESLADFRDELSPEEYERAQRAIADQIAALQGLETAAQRAARQADELQRALNSALPERQRVGEYVEQITTLRDAFLAGRIEADLYNEAIAALADNFDQERAQQAADRVRELNDALSDRSATPFAKYADEIELLNRAMDELPDQAGNLAQNLQRAFANLDFEIQAELTTVTGNDNESLRRDFQAKREALEQFIEERGRTEEQADADRLALAQSYSDQIFDNTQDLQRRLIGLTSNSEPLLFDIQIQSEESDLDRILRDRGATEDEFRLARESQEQAHQDRLNELVRSGEFTREQFEQASFQSRLGGLLEKYGKEIDVATSAASTILDVRVNREKRQADAARTEADEAQSAYDVALRNFEQNGTEENRIALENATKKRNIAQREAKKQFEDQKKASIASAKLSAGVAILNALATPPWYVGLAQAGIALYKTRDIIKGIKAQTYQGGGSSSFGSGSGTTSGSSVGSGGTQTGQTSDQPTNSMTVIIAPGNFQTEQEAVNVSSRAFQKAVVQGHLFLDPDSRNGFNFDNIPNESVRLT